MYKRIVQIRKKADISRADFIDYYENKHVPLITKLLGINGNLNSIYRRNYLIFDDPNLSFDNFGGSRNDAGYDVLTERIFGTREDSDRVIAALANADIYAQIKADEANFVEAGGTKSFAVDVYQSKYP